jgi:Ca2+-binding EF-hand superfamily protein
MKEFNNVFEFIDGNHTGMLCKKDILKAIFYSCPNLNAEEISMQVYGYNLLNTADTISYLEFIAMCIDQHKMIPKETLWIVFRYLSD